jgi:hypothetical protein
MSFAAKSYRHEEIITVLISQHWLLDSSADHDHAHLKGSQPDDNYSEHNFPAMIMNCPQNHHRKKSLGNKGLFGPQENQKAVAEFAPH